MDTIISIETENLQGKYYKDCSVLNGLIRPVQCLTLSNGVHFVISSEYLEVVHAHSLNPHLYHVTII